MPIFHRSWPRPCHALAAATGIALAAASAAAQPDSASRAPAAPLVKWEYAEFRSEYGGRWEWRTADNRVVTDNYAKFLRSLGFDSLLAAPGGNVAFMTALGEYGWELVTCYLYAGPTGVLSEGHVQVCLFKRPREAAAAPPASAEQSSP
jgi:hypothetical protein